MVLLGYKDDAIFAWWEEKYTYLNEWKEHSALDIMYIIVCVGPPF